MVPGTGKYIGASPLLQTERKPRISGTPGFDPLFIYLRRISAYWRATPVKIGGVLVGMRQ